MSVLRTQLHQELNDLQMMLLEGETTTQMPADFSRNTQSKAAYCRFPHILQFVNITPIPRQNPFIAQTGSKRYAYMFK